MNGKQIVTKLDALLQWIVRLVLLNILWILFSALGLFAAGVFPATAAVLAVARKWVMGEQDIKIWSTFKQVYRQEFLAANSMGWILSVIGAILYFNHQVMTSHIQEMSFVVPFAFYFIVFFYTMLVIWSFPLLAHYKANWHQHFKNAIIIGLTKIHYTIVCGAVVFAVLYFSLSFPGLLPFFTISTIGVGCMWLALQIFSQLDQDQTHQAAN
ncbi:YesL family protein [Mesobacillus foraminis]|uniref:YesL family protein n=1 Tax=Mesobacillus foraminis TaxID=279826 RepID=UPI001BEA8A7F|nr:YesL family protein [Mesobacillus foraminis]MBT2757034.1 YesL family protein [Mesobacillus foraminis]